jgi:hypothetical protein
MAFEGKFHLNFDYLTILVLLEYWGLPSHQIVWHSSQVQIKNKMWNALVQSNQN